MLAINTCPRKENGETAKLLNPFLDGARGAGAEIELYYAADLIIFPCCGNLNCTIRTPGRCMACDDIRWLRPRIGEADILVLASPLYFNGRTGSAGVTGSMKQLMDRIVPGSHPPESPYPYAVHVTREQVNLRQVVIVSGYGFLEIQGFYPALTHLKALCYNSFPELAGCITGFVGAKVHGVLPEGATEREVAGMAQATGRELALACKGMHRLTPLMACDGRAKASDRRREWAGEILYKF